MQFILLESMTGSDYTKVWAPYYTAHKILRGLLDAHTATGDERALDLASGMGNWMYSRLSVLPAATLQRMWGIFSSGEFGGIVEAVYDLHQLTGKAEHLALARLFDLDSLIDACAADTDALNGLHANQHIPAFTGLVRLYDATGEERYLTAAKNFWGMVVPHRMYGIGGTSTGEFWKARDVIAGTIGATTAESCCAYNMLKLSRALCFHEQDPAYMDYYERALYNQVLGSKQDRADAEKPLVTYFIGLTPGHVRDYTPKQGTTCCEGTGCWARRTATGSWPRRGRRRTRADTAPRHRAPT
ncbi:beta-L-arabinofuranosidase (glycosyl hydrolase family 127) [Streptomyces sp. Ag109_O5-1]|nr:beta-L-arabinofuranosidase (glycosyl hydrolase family 127) [Streptomyces sp. Ag109_O5-1]